MDGDHDIEARLGALGRVPIDPATAEQHLAAIGALAPGRSGRWRPGWKIVVGAGLAGFLAGSTGLAAAGSLPAPAQDVAHDVLATVGIDVPRSTEGCPEGTSFRNHGEYVSSVEAAGGDVEAAAHSDCGMPVRSGGRGGGGAGGGGEPGTPRPDEDGDPCTGPPPWAGAHLDRELRRALQEEHRLLCGDDLDDDEAEEVPDEETTTTVAALEDETTTTLAETTTTAPEDTTTTTG